MQIVKCKMADTDELAAMNKHLIEDEKSSNPMSRDELQKRMTGFLSGEYEAFFFVDENAVIGYALVKRSVSPLYLRQFFIKEIKKGHIIWQTKKKKLFLLIMSIQQIMK